jgi:hypothetical protein
MWKLCSFPGFQSRLSKVIIAKHVLHVLPKTGQSFPLKFMVILYKNISRVVVYTYIFFLCQYTMYSVHIDTYVTHRILLNQCTLVYFDQFPADECADDFKSVSWLAFQALWTTSSIAPVREQEFQVTTFGKRKGVLCVGVYLFIEYPKSDKT